jgi:hypothetical protein
MADHQHLLIKKEGRSLSGKALIELIQAVHEKGMPFRFRASGFSMSPFISDGDIITVIPKREAPVRIGDIVAFIHNETDRCVVHRVIKRQGDSLKIRGDNNPNEDGLIPSSNILGTVSCVERDGKKISLGLGWERRVIAFLSGASLLDNVRCIIAPLWKVLRPVLKKGLS